MTDGSLTLPGNPRNGSASSAPTVWRTATHEYALVTQLDWRPFIYKRALPDGPWVGHDLSATALGTMNASDSHNTIALAVDAEGIIHVAGNMHQEGMRYITSAAPGDITSWVNVTMPSWWSRTVTNLVRNPAVETLVGWETIAGYTGSQEVTPASDPSKPPLRSFKTVKGASDGSARRGVARVGATTASSLPVVGGQVYTAYFQVKDLSAAAAGTAANSTVRVSIEWRAGGQTITTTSGAEQNVPSNARFWPFWFTSTAPANATSAVIRCEVRAKPGQTPQPGSVCLFDSAMLLAGAKDSYDYADPSIPPPATATTPAGWVWTGAAHDSPSTGSIKMLDTTGANVSTYQRFDRFSDGTIVWSHDQSDSHEAVGRDWILLRKPPGSGWQPCVGQGEIMTTVGGLSNGADAIPDRSYLLALHVDRHDVLHAVIVWRRHTSSGTTPDTSPGTMDLPIYVRSHDKGSTWLDVRGVRVDAPFRAEDLVQPVIQDGTPNLAPRYITIDGQHHAISVVGNLAIDGLGHAHLTASMCHQPTDFSGAPPSSRGPYHVWWDGSEWRREPIGAPLFNDLPTISFHRGDTWLWGYRGGLTPGLHGRNHSRWPAGTYLRLGACLQGTEASFKSGATYTPAPTHAGGLSPGGRPVMRVSLPDGDAPRTPSYGGGPLVRTPPPA